MISEIVLFRLPDGMSRADAMVKYRARVPMWQANADLVHKAFCLMKKPGAVAVFTSGRILRLRRKHTVRPSKKQFNPSLVRSPSSNISKHPLSSTMLPKKWSTTQLKVSVKFFLTVGREHLRGSL